LPAILGEQIMQLDKFIKMVDGLDVFEKAVFYLGGLKELESGYWFKVITSKGINYIRSIGNHHIVILDENQNEIENLGRLGSNGELVLRLRWFYEGTRVRTITII